MDRVDTTEYHAREIEREPSKLPLDAQEKNLAELHESIEVLKQVLRFALRPEEPTEKSAEDKAVAFRSPLADKLDAHNASIRYATRKVRDLIDRVEV